MGRGGRRTKPTDKATSGNQPREEHTSNQKKKEPPKVILGEPNLSFAPTDLPASPDQSTTTDSVEWCFARFFVKTGRKSRGSSHIGLP